jgi:integrase
MALTESRIKNAKPQDKPYQMPDGGGLYLEVKPNGSKLWRFRYRLRGIERRLSLGEYPYVSLREARETHFTMKQQLARKQDPKSLRESERAAATTFGEVALEWLRINHGNWSESHVKSVKQRLDKNLLPLLGSRPIQEITPTEVLEAVRRVEDRGAYETAHRCLNICSQIFRYGIVSQKCYQDPCAGLSKALAPVVTHHMAAITDPSELGRILRMIFAYQPGTIVGTALRLHPYLFCRPGELRQMQWAEIDFDSAEWRFILSKTKQPQIIPLSRQALNILKDIYSITGDGKYVFPSARSNHRPMSNMACLVALRAMGISREEMSNHGWRATARTLLDEALGYPPHLIEQQLGHTVRDPLGRAYNRTKHLEERRQMMQSWADYLDRLRDG